MGSGAEEMMAVLEEIKSEVTANTYDHEKGHLVRHISQHLGLEPYGEQEQYIAGYISQQMFSVAKSFLCEHCRQNNNALANFIRVFL